MPLRAKILQPGFLSSSKEMFSAAAAPGDEADDVLFASNIGARTITLNRPAKLNSLNGSMIRKMVPRLQEWEASELANVIILKGDGKAFCAGGDVAALAKLCTEGKAGQQQAQDYFAMEYVLDHYVATYKKPVVALMNGITMGGGVGLSVHAPFRIATEKTVFAMPETTIGFFPDVGTSFFLPRLDGATGTYLALTSERLTGFDAYMGGVATHYIASDNLPSLEARLAELRPQEGASKSDHLRTINDAIDEFAADVPEGYRFFMSGEARQAIDRCFSATTVEGVLESLEKEGTEWAAKTLKTLRERSPTSVRVAHRQMREGRNWNIMDTFRHEHQIASRFMSHPDFVEGVSSRLIRKPPTKPKWQPATLEDTSPHTADEFFRGGHAKGELQLLTPVAYHEKRYPFHFGLPTERMVRSVVNSEGRDASSTAATRAEHLDRILQRYRHKPGTRERIIDILQRKTTEQGEQKMATWID